MNFLSVLFAADYHILNSLKNNLPVCLSVPFKYHHNLYQALNPFKKLSFILMLPS